MSHNRNTQENIISRFKDIHGNRYNYCLVEYKTLRTKVKIICYKHGVFEMTPHSHLSGSKCKLCPRYETEEWILKARKVHGVKYDYSLVEYKSWNEKIKIICPEHGLFLQAPNDHLQKKGCQKCSLAEKKKPKKTLKDFISKANNIHKNKYNYSNVVLQKYNKKVKIICPIHGPFLQKPTQHIALKQGCQTCAIQINAKKRRLSTEEFIAKAKEVHGDKYDYSLVDYKKTKDKVKIICPRHGIFEQKPADHLQQKGCNKCSTSGYNKQITGNLYIHSVLNYSANKVVGYTVGITNSKPEKRLKEIQNSSVLNHQLIFTLKGPGDKIADLEKEIHQRCGTLDMKHLIKDGGTEVIPPESYKLCKEIIEEFKDKNNL